MPAPSTPTVKVDIDKGSAAPLNGLVLLALAVYLGAVVLKGNLGAFLKTFWDDITGQGTARPAFWQWAIALVVLILLAENDTIGDYFAPFLAIMLVAMLIQLATKQPQLFANLNSALNTVFGGR